MEDKQRQSRNRGRASSFNGTSSLPARVPGLRTRAASAKLTPPVQLTFTLTEDQMRDLAPLSSRGPSVSSSLPAQAPGLRAVAGSTNIPADQMRDLAPFSTRGPSVGSSLPAQASGLRAVAESTSSRSISADKLIELTKPKTFEGPTAEVQKEIVAKLEKEISDWVQINKKNDALVGLGFVGAIELTNLHKDDTLGKLIANAELIDLLPKHQSRQPGDAHALATHQTFFEHVKKAGVEKQIITNTLATMEKAGQLDYLRESGLIDSEWKVLIEVHFYRNRSKGDTNLHKDTLGETLFVNLNFVNDQEMPGPEYIVNPASSEENDRRVSDNLPSVFVRDLKRGLVSEPTEFGASRIPKNGVVAFVDEAVHHKTPTLGRRTVPAKDVAEKYPDIERIAERYPDIKRAYDKFENRTLWWSFKSYLPSQYQKDANTWQTIMASLKTKNPKYNRDELVLLLPNVSSDEIDELIEKEWLSQFGQASIPKFGNLPVKKPNRPMLKRQMSQEIIRGTAPKPLPEGTKRTFFRTWVRAVRK